MRPLPPGLYDRLVSGELAAQLAALQDPRLRELAAVDPAEAPEALAAHLEVVIASLLATQRGDDASSRQRSLANKLLETLAAELQSGDLDHYRLTDPLQRLLAVHASPPARTTPRPDVPLARSTLLTGARLDPSLASQLSKEIATADRVDILCSFIRWSGLRLLLPDLEQLVEQPGHDGPRLRVITTSYMGATEPEAVERLARLPNTEIRVSYDTSRTRLHAKAYVIHRRTGFGSAYVGSANLSHAAFSEGLEWTSKLSQFELPYLWQRILATFDVYWNSTDFHSYGPETRDRLRTAIRREQGARDNDPEVVHFDLAPHPFQEEILDAIASERSVQGKSRHLIVAATGTGKTMIAAFDFRRWASGGPPWPPLLFVAHREEILRQARSAYRGVLRDQNFGELVVAGGGDPHGQHLFCSIQSYNARQLWSLPPDRFRYVVVDEFHHAAAESYQRLLGHVQPEVLLGLTATPERSDGLDVFQWFGGEASAEIRLPDAINRQLLVPFHYFGVTDHDSVQLEHVTWQRGGYRPEELDQILTGNHARAGLVLQKVNELLLHPQRMRGLGFCVSIAHAEFMARFMSERGVPSLALSANSSADDRRTAAHRLRAREINLIFAVDLYNEGVDIPEIDTVLFLRPTESLTVFLQQLGRGLRRDKDKECLTVLDFIGQHRREFRFAQRFRSLCTDPTLKIDREIESSFPHMPAGCEIRLERVARERVLANVRETIELRRPRLVADLRDLGRLHGRPPTIHEAMEHLSTDLSTLLSKGMWSRLLAEAGLLPPFTEPDETQLARGIQRAALADDPAYLAAMLRLLEQPQLSAPESASDRRRLEMLLACLFGATGSGPTFDHAMAILNRNPNAKSDLLAVLRHRLHHTRVLVRDIPHDESIPLALHAAYTRDELLIAIGHGSFDAPRQVREGVVRVPGRDLELLFVTLDKTEDAYSPTTMYEDYAISDSLFHWQTQSTVSVDSPTGQRYLNHQSLGHTILLTVREHRKRPDGLAAPYAYLGPVEYVSHSGSRPINIVWRLRTPMPARLVRETVRQASA